MSESDNDFVANPQRIGRLEYLIKELGIIILAATVYTVVKGTISALLDFMALIILIALLVFHFSATLKRLQDMGYGNWLLVLLAALINVALVVLAVWPGQATANEYGPPPKQPFDGQR